MLGLLDYKIPMGPSHAIGHQLGSSCGVMHGVTSCIILPPVLRYMRDVKGQQERGQKQVLQIFNEVLGWGENSAADAVARFVQSLELPGSLSAAGVEHDDCLDKVTELTMTDVWGGSKKQIETKEEV